MISIRINLLPHREQRRALQQKALIALMAIAAAAGIALILVGQMVLSNNLDMQNQRNELIKAETAKLDHQITEIAELKDKTNALLARKQVVEKLQVNRAEVVHLFDEISRLLPDGMYLKSLKQTGERLTITGFAQSSARVSTLMRNIETSSWLASPKLIEVKVINQNGFRVSEFSLEVAQTVPTSPEGKAGKL